MDVMTIDEKILVEKNKISEFRDLQNAETRLFQLEETKAQEQREKQQRQKAMSLQKQIDSFEVDNSVVPAVQDAIIGLAQCLSKWQSEKVKLQQLYALIQQQVLSDWDNRTLELSGPQMNAARQGFKSLIIQEITQQRVEQITSESLSLDIELSGIAHGDVRQWSEYLLNAVKQTQLKYTTSNQVTI